MITLRIKVRLSAGVEREVFAACGAIVRARLQAQIEETFDALLSHHGADVPIRLSINLGTLHPVTWKSEFASLALSALRRHTFTVRRGGLVDSMRSAVTSETVVLRRASAPDVTARSDVATVHVPENVDATQTALEAFAAFLEKGHFSRSPPWKNGSAAVWFAEALDDHARHTVERVLGWAIRDVQGYSRLQHIVGPVLSARAKALCDGGSGHGGALTYLSGTLGEDPTPWGARSPAAWFEAQWRARSVESRALFATIQADPKKRLALAALIGPVRAAPLLQRLDDADDVNNRKPVSIHDMGSNLSSQTTHGKRRGTSKTSRQRYGDAAPIVVANAGLICLWPLIPAVLGALHVLPNAVSKGEVADAEDGTLRVSAAIVLDYLVWGDPEWQEWRMPISKLLCGLSQDTLIDVPQLTQECRTTIDSWLQALPSRLPGLHGCGVSDLRQFFLQRPGGLLSDKGHWRIDVAPDASDVLLDALPWPMQQVVLPWLTDPIQVVWR